MILDAASKAMNQLIESQWNDLYPDEGLSEWEMEGAGYQKGFAAGEVKGLRVALFDVLQLRGFSVDASVRARIEQCSDPAQLDRWRELAKDVDRIEWVFSQED